MVSLSGVQDVGGGRGYIAGYLLGSRRSPLPSALSAG
jgi:hypothetical protein